MFSKNTKCGAVIRMVMNFIVDDERLVNKKQLILWYACVSKDHVNGGGSSHMKFSSGDWVIGNGMRTTEIVKPIRQATE